MKAQPKKLNDDVIAKRAAKLAKIKARNEAADRVKACRQARKAQRIQD